MLHVDFFYRSILFIGTCDVPKMQPKNRPTGLIAALLQLQIERIVAADFTEITGITKIRCIHSKIRCI